MNSQLEQLRKDHAEYLTLGSDRIKWPDPTAPHEGGIKEQRRLSNLQYDIKNRVIHDNVLMLVMGGILDISTHLVHKELYRYVYNYVMSDIKEAPVNIYADEQRNATAHESISRLERYMKTGDLEKVAKYAKEVEQVLYEWYDGDADGHGSWTGDDGYDYLTAALSNLGWLAQIQVDDYKDFHAYLTNPEDNGEYPQGGCDGEPRYGWLYKIYCEEFDIDYNKED